MRKALVILFYWPPAGGSAVQRWLRFCKYLPEYGWEPVVYAPDQPQYPETDSNLIREIPEKIEVLKTPILEPHQFYKKFVGLKKEEKIAASMTMQSQPQGWSKLKSEFALWIRSNLFIPDARFLWIRPSVKYLKKYLLKEKIDIIITTGPPHSLHLIGLKLHNFTGIPWVADFRDPWTSIDFYADLKLTEWADRKHHKLEARVLRNADHVIAVSPDMAEEFHNLGAKKVTVITNGFDDSDIPVKKEDPGKEFSIIHLGTLSTARNSSSLWKAISSKVAENDQFRKDLRIRLVGNVDYKVKAEIEKTGLTNHTEYIDFIPHKQAMELLGKSQVLLLLINNSVNAKGVITGKLFEYLAVRRPILLIGPTDGDAAIILKETESGLCAGFDDEIAIRTHMDLLYDSYTHGNLTVSATSINKYSRRALSGKLAEVLNSIT